MKKGNALVSFIVWAIIIIGIVVIGNFDSKKNTSNENNTIKESTVVKKTNEKSTKKQTTKKNTSKNKQNKSELNNDKTFKCDYILNKNTKKFHYTWCSSVNKMKSSNTKEYTGTRDAVINMGYVPCKRCNP